MTYHRRFNTLSVIMAQTEAKSILKVKADILGEDCSLGKNFRNQVVKNTGATTKMHNAEQREKRGAKAKRQASRQTISQEKSQCDSKPFSQQFGISCANTRFRFTKRTPIHKKSILGNQNTSGPSSRKTKMLPKVLGKLTRDPDILGITQGFQIPFKRKPSKNSKSLR